MKYPDLHIIIPTLNEAENLGRLLYFLTKKCGFPLNKITVVDGGSADDTIEIATKANVRVLKGGKRGRAVQMNFGAAQVKEEILYFVHADTIPPISFLSDISESLNEGFDMGCFRLAFEGGPWLLKINSFFTRFDWLWCRGGDQSFFIKRAVFEKLGGYREDFLIMEEYEFFERARENYSFKIIPKYTLASTRKYRENNYFRVQLANFRVFKMYKKGASQEAMVQIYRRMLNYR